MAKDEGLPPLKEAIEQWLGVELPTIPLPQTVRNLDKAIGKVVLAAGDNIEKRIRRNTDRAVARGRIEIDGMYRTEEEKRKLENRIKTTKLAFQELERGSGGTTDAPSEIDDDWLNLFARLCEDKSSEELQILFGKCLSGEIRKPGSFSLRTVQMMATISKSDAEAVSKFLSFTLDGLIIPFQSGDCGPTDADRLLMEELGVAGHPSQIGGMALNITIEPNSKTLHNGIGLGILIENKTDHRIDFPISGQAASTSARELIPIANSPNTDSEFLKAVAQDVRRHLQGVYGADLDKELILVHVVTAELIGPNSYKYNIILTVPKP